MPESLTEDGMSSFLLSNFSDAQIKVSFELGKNYLLVERLNKKPKKHSLYAHVIARKLVTQLL